MKDSKFFSRSLLRILAISIPLVFLFACATGWQTLRHGILMKGTVLESYDSEVYICIGKKDGATVGQELDVYKVRKVSGGGPRSKLGVYGPPKFHWEKTGKVRIIEILDEHMSKAAVISGKAEEDDIVQLEAP